jgi:hypothetical protein
VNEWVWSTGRMILTGENWSSWRKTWPNSASSTRNSAWTDFGLNLVLCSCGGCEWKTENRRNDSEHPVQLVLGTFRIHSWNDSCSQKALVQHQQLKLPCLWMWESRWRSNPVASLFLKSRTDMSTCEWQVTNYFACSSFTVRRTVCGSSYCSWRTTNVSRFMSVFCREPEGFGVCSLLCLDGQVCANPGFQVFVATKFCTVAPNVCGSSVWNFLHVTLLAFRILTLLLDFGKFVHPWSIVRRPTLRKRKDLILALKNPWLSLSSSSSSSRGLSYDRPIACSTVRSPESAIWCFLFHLPLVTRKGVGGRRSVGKPRGRW